MLAGLLQDIGSLPLLAELEHWPDFPRDAEHLDGLCDYLSGDIGALVLTRWQVPTTLIECARQRNKWLHDHAGEADLTDLVLLASALQIQPRSCPSPCPRSADWGLNNHWPACAKSYWPSNSCGCACWPEHLWPIDHVVLNTQAVLRAQPAPSKICRALPYP